MNPLVSPSTLASTCAPASQPKSPLSPLSLSSRYETDSLGVLEVASDRYWGAQTQRALQHFKIGDEVMPREVIAALCVVKKAAAIVNHECGLLESSKANLIIAVATEVIDGLLDVTAHFPLHVWQSGSGTQTNMNVNEVIANRASELVGGIMGSKNPLHPNDDVNMSQSTNDVFPTAMHIAAYTMIKQCLLSAVGALRQQLAQKQAAFADIVKIGRTHLQDAVPLTLGQEFSGYVAQLDIAVEQIHCALTQLQELAIGATAVGTGLNAPLHFDTKMSATIAELTGIPFHCARNKFAAIAGHEALLAVSAALRTLACALFKIADDIRWLASGPRTGLGELTLPSNEPGSSIMPGKINPTQCEMVTMVVAQVIGNDAALAFAASQGKFELNTFKPMIIYNLLQSVRLLADACNNFAQYAVAGLTANESSIAKFLGNSLMLVTALVPKIGYDKAAQVAQLAMSSNISLRDAALQLGYVNVAEFDETMSQVIAKVRVREGARM